MDLNWMDIVIPVAVFLVSLAALLWLRMEVYTALAVRLKRTGWEGTEVITRAIRRPSVLLCLIIGAVVALTVSKLPPEWKNPIYNGLGSLFVVAFTFLILSITAGLISLYGPTLKMPRHVQTVIKNITKGIILTFGLLIILDIWGLPTTPVILLIVVAVLAAALALRDTVPSLFAGLQISSTQQIKVGDYIKLETGEEGYVTAIRWNNTHVKALDESTVIVPNSHLLEHTVINYGHPLKKAKEPFRFTSRTHLTELTGLKAGNLRELLGILKTAPDAVVYYHTHRFLEQYHYLTPELSNDFALWVQDALGDEMLGERLASIDTFAFPNLGALRGRLVTIIEESLATTSIDREAMAGREFYFMKSVSVIFPTPYVVHDLREVVEALRKISLGALYFHVFESRLRLERGLNDFTVWLKDSLGETELGDEIARLDPYTYTLEGLRSLLIQRIEKRIK